jgi:hypothetical protein
MLKNMAGKTGLQLFIQKYSERRGVFPLSIPLGAVYLILSKHKYSHFKFRFGPKVRPFARQRCGRTIDEAAPKR